MIFFLIIDPAGFQLVELTARREADLNYSIFNRQSSINAICDLLKPSFLYNMLLEKMDEEPIERLAVNTLCDFFQEDFGLGQLSV